MKKIFLFFVVVTLSSNVSKAQEWMTSLDVAKRLALVQDKMLFAMWENSLSEPYPISFKNERGDLVVTDLSKDASMDSTIWEYFIPVLLSESKYPELSHQVKETRGLKYYNKLIDDSIKIMDANGNILNTNPTEIYYVNLSDFIKKYSLNTSFLKQDLVNYSKKKNFITSLNLAIKYQDYALFAEKGLRSEIINLANIYFDEARNHLRTSVLKNKLAFDQKINLLEFKTFLILDNPRKVRRLIKKINIVEVDEINLSLFSFLHYTMHTLLGNEEEAAMWKSKVSLVDLKKAELIFKNNL